MQIRQLFSTVLVLIGAAPAAAGTTTINGNIFDTQSLECQGIAAEAHLGAITSTGAAKLKWQHGDLSDGTDMTDVEGSGSDANDTQGSKLLGTQIHRPTKRYMRPVLVRSTANVVLNSIIVLVWNTSREPVTQTDMVDVATVNDPVSGTA